MALVLFGGIVSVTEPLPVPELGVAPNPEAVHKQDEFDVVTLTDAIPPAVETCRLAGLIPNEQPVLANCVMVNNCPLTLIVPVRCVAPVFAVSLKEIVFDPVLL